MNIFKKTEHNPYNIGDIFNMKAELTEITKEGTTILYKIRPMYKGASNIYGVSLEQLREMEIN